MSQLLLAVITNENLMKISFFRKLDKFLDVFINSNGYTQVLTGLKNTVIIAILGLVIGIVIGTLIATVRVVPKYKTLPRVLNGICSVYVSFFRGTPMVAQLLLFYYVMLPLMGTNMSGVKVSVIVFGLNSGAYISEIMRSGIQSVDGGQMEAGRAFRRSATSSSRSSRRRPSCPSSARPTCMWRSTISVRTRMSSWCRIL